MSIPLNIDWQQILLHLFNFAILAGGLYLLLYKPVKQFMEQREADYRKAHDAAQAAQAQAEQLKADQTAVWPRRTPTWPRNGPRRSRSWRSCGPGQIGRCQKGGGAFDQGPGKRPP